MQLPFLDKKRIAGSIMETVRKPKSEEPEKKEELEISEELMAIAEDLISAVHAKNAKNVAIAMKAAFLVLENEPHQENEQE